jgi:hypothetical protein
MCSRFIGLPAVNDAESSLRFVDDSPCGKGDCDAKPLSSLIARDTLDLSRCADKVDERCGGT